ncbi:MAG: phosphopantetheine-binding protein [Bacteroidota bacterium]
MKINEFIIDFSNQFDTPIEINENTTFKDLEEWDSLTALSIILMVDEKYGMMLTGDEIRNSQTINDLFEVLKNK